MLSSLTKYFPLLWVDLATAVTLLPLSLLFYYESLTNILHLRWQVPILGPTLSEQDYRSEMFKDASHICCFVIWTLQVLMTEFVILFHVTHPHHPKFYSTRKNRIAIILHIIGGTIGVHALYLGVVLNIKIICYVGAVAGATLHLPSVVWNNRQTHGQREMSQPAYFMTSFLLLKSYVDIFLYDANFQTIFSCAMTLNIYAMVRFYYLVSSPKVANIESSYDRTLFFAGFSNFPFCQGMFTPLYFLFGFFLWNTYFNIIKPFPKFMMRVERGYWDSIPDSMEEKRGITFEQQLIRQMESESDKKEAIAKSLWMLIVGDENQMDIKYIEELYEAWGMPDAKSASKATFKRVDTDKSGTIDYDEFKKGFHILIDGIFIVGEHESKDKQQQRLKENEMSLKKKINLMNSKPGIKIL
jgi:hypothetical protein